MRPFLLIAAALTCWSSAAMNLPAAIHVVDSAGGPGAHFTSLAAAVAAAVDGDTLLVRPGVYGPTLVHAKSLHIVRDGAGPAFVHGITVRALAEMQSVTMRGLRIIGLSAVGLSLRENAVTFVRCLVQAGHGADVRSQGVQPFAVSGSPGIWVREGRVALYDSHTLGGNRSARSHCSARRVRAHRRSGPALFSGRPDATRAIAATHWTMQALAVDAGGVLVLSSASALTVLDASF